MTFEAGPNITRLRGVFTGVDGAPYYSGLTINVGGGSVDAEVGVWTDLWDALAAFRVNECTFQSEGSHPVIAVATGETVGIATSDEPSSPGIGAGEALPWATQIYVSLHTGEYVNGRELKGGFYLPAVDTNMNVEGNFDSSSADYVDATMATWLFGGDHFNGSVLVYSPTHRVAAYVTQARVRRDFAVLRSRRD